MREVTLSQIFNHHIAQKYLSRSGIVHAIACAYHAFKLAKIYDVSVDLATKAALLHDMGHYTWYRNGKWDYELYRKNDIHAIKGAERAHKLLIRLGENPIIAKEIALAILFHTDSYMPEAFSKRTPLQEIVKLADEMDEEQGGMHHYKKMDKEKSKKMIERLDQMVNEELKKHAIPDGFDPA
ncbi:HD domain-containing protein [Neobacillus niacini]|uniref:HD domain-containing protein n=1 Tax=Neobacillus niacini TaxID=86668 RepID=UPI0021CB21E7|nr:HD domain-containing protein [Neobacillus niacini]MCM3767057.1 HD domain-containing protein [Neobacillus niacini]